MNFQVGIYTLQILDFSFQMSVQPGMGMNPQMQLQSYYQQACRDGMLTTTEVMTAMNMLGVPIDSATAQQLLMQISLGGCANQGQGLEKCNMRE